MDSDRKPLMFYCKEVLNCSIFNPNIRMKCSLCGLWCSDELGSYFLGSNRITDCPNVDLLRQINAVEKL